MAIWREVIDVRVEDKSHLVLWLLIAALLLWLSLPALLEHLGWEVVP